MEHVELAQTQITRDLFHDLGCGLNEHDHERDLGPVAKQRDSQRDFCSSQRDLCICNTTVVALYVLELYIVCMYYLDSRV